jgi:hypothetical protein
MSRCEARCGGRSCAPDPGGDARCPSFAVEVGTDRRAANSCVYRGISRNNGRWRRHVTAVGLKYRQVDADRHAGDRLDVAVAVTLGDRMTNAQVPLRRSLVLGHRRRAVAAIVMTIGMLSAIVCVQFASASTTYPSDTFNHRTMRGWGEAEVGGAYSYLGSRSSYYVAGGRGVMNAAPGQARGAFVQAPTGQIQMTAGVRGPNRGGGWGYAAYVTVRRNAGVGDYRARVHVDRRGRVMLAIARGSANGADVLLSDEIELPDVRFSSRTSVRLTLSASGANPTTLRAKAWKDGSPVPAGWNLTVKDAAAGVQAGGEIGIGLYNSSSARTRASLRVFAWNASSPDALIPPTQPSTTGPSPTDAPTTASTTTSTTTTHPPANSSTTVAPSVPTTDPLVTQTPTTRASTQEGANGSFRVECEFSHRAQVDPIVAPGGVSMHMHDFFGNRSTGANSTYASMSAAPTNCSESGDTAGYWSPTLVAPNGAFVDPESSLFYYRNRPYDYGITVPFPPNFRMIAGGTFPNAYWTCDGESDTGFSDRKAQIPDCGRGGKIKLHVFFPSCWDGVHLDSPDHRSHVAYGLDEDDGAVDGTDPDECPASHPIKIPQLDFRALYDVEDGTGYRLSDGMQLPHSDFWNTWDQDRLEHWVSRCLGRVGQSCGLAEN